VPLSMFIRTFVIFLDSFNFEEADDSRVIALPEQSVEANWEGESTNDGDMLMDMFSEQPIPERSVRDMFYHPIQELPKATTYHDPPIEMYFLRFPSISFVFPLSYFEGVAEMPAIRRILPSRLSSRPRSNGVVNVIVSVTSITPVSHAPAARVPIKRRLALLPSWAVASIVVLLVNISVLLVRRGNALCIARDAGK